MKTIPFNKLVKNWIKTDPGFVHAMERQFLKEKRKMTKKYEVEINNISEIVLDELRIGLDCLLSAGKPGSALGRWPDHDELVAAYKKIIAYYDGSDVGLKPKKRKKR